MRHLNICRWVGVGRSFSPPHTHTHSHIYRDLEKLHDNVHCADNFLAHASEHRAGFPGFFGGRDGRTGVCTGWGGYKAKPEIIYIMITLRGRVCVCVRVQMGHTHTHTHRKRRGCRTAGSKYLPEKEDLSSRLGDGLGLREGGLAELRIVRADTRVN